jgi:hypothetical protein
MTLKYFFLTIVPLVLFFSCRKTPSSSTSLTDNEVIPVEAGSTAPSAPDFDFTTAKVYEKAGRKEDIREILTILSEAGLISSSQFEDFSARNEKDSLTGNFEIVKAIKSAITIDLNTVKDTFPHFYKKLYEDILKKENIACSDIKVTSEYYKDSSEGIRELRGRISFRSGDREFLTSVRADSANRQLDENFYQLINNLKMARGDQDRLYLFRKIMVYSNDTVHYYSTDNRDYVLARLEEPVALALHHFPNAVDISYEEHRVPVSGDQIREAFISLRKSGFFTTLQESEINAWQKKCEESVLFNSQDLFYTIRPLRICLDSYTDFKNKPYSGLLTALSEFSQKKFNPVNIEEQSAPNSEGEIKFRLGNKVYSGKFQNTFDRIDIAGLTDLINHALNDQKTDGNFYLLTNPDRLRCYIFMQEAQLNTANNLFSR